MSQVTVAYLQADGRFRRKKASIETKWPNYSLNHRDKQAHDLIDNPIFPVYSKHPLILRSWEDLLTATPPPVPRVIDKVMMVCEDNSIWPVSMNGDPDLDDRQMSRKDHFEEGFQFAKAAATRDSMGSPILAAWSIVGMVVFAVAAVLIALFFVQIKFGDQISQSVSSIPIFWATLGAVATLTPPVPAKGALNRLRVRFKRKPKLPKEKKPDLGPLEDVIVYDELAQRAWGCLMHLNVLTQWLPTTSRYTQEIGPTRWLAAGIGTAVGFGILFGALVAFYGQIMGAVFGLLIGAPTGAVFGYFGLAGFLQIKPIWIVRRRFLRDEEGNADYDSLPEVFPEEHTHLMGIPVEEARQMRGALAAAGMRQKVQQGSSGGSGESGIREGGNVTNVTPAMLYNPTVHRATTLYEEMMQRDFREYFKGGMTTSQKIMTGSFMMIAVGSLGLLVFLVMITAK